MMQAILCWTLCLAWIGALRGVVRTADHGDNVVFFATQVQDASWTNIRQKRITATRRILRALNILPE